MRRNTCIFCQRKLDVINTLADEMTRLYLLLEEQRPAWYTSGHYNRIKAALEQAGVDVDEPGLEKLVRV